MCVSLKFGATTTDRARCVTTHVSLFFVTLCGVGCGQNDSVKSSGATASNTSGADLPTVETTTRQDGSSHEADESVATSGSSTPATSQGTSGQPQSHATNDATSDQPTLATASTTSASASSTATTATATTEVIGVTETTGTAPSTALPLPEFTRHEVGTFANGYYVSAFDIDGDGLRDIAVNAAGGSEIAWFQNPTWEQFSVTTDVNGVICMAPHDVDGDGDLDLAFASEFSMTATSTGGTVQWAEAPDDPLTSDSWALHPIGAIPTSHRVRWANLDGVSNNTLVVLPIFGRGSASPAYEGAVELTAYAPDPANDGEWVGTLLDDTLLEVAHGMSIVDWDGDGIDDILTAANAGIHLFQPHAGNAPVQLGVGAAGEQPDKGSSEVGLGVLDHDRFIASVEPWHGTDLVIYTPNEAGGVPWTRTVFGTEFGKGHALMTADLNADGYDEIIAGDQGGQGALLVYRYDTTADEWQRIDLDVGSIAVVGLDVQDVNSDGTLDIVAIGGSTNNVVWYENPPTAGN